MFQQTIQITTGASVPLPLLVDEKNESNEEKTDGEPIVDSILKKDGKTFVSFGQLFAVEVGNIVMLTVNRNASIRQNITL